MIPRPRAEGGASDDRSAAASDGMTCSPIPMPCRSLAVARSLLQSDPQAGVAIAMCAVFVSSGSLTHSVRRFARLRSSRLFSSLLLLYTCSFCHAYLIALGRGDAWLSRCVRYGMVWPCGRCRGDGRSDDAMRMAERAVSGTKGETHGETGSERVMRRFCQLDLAVPMLSLPGVGFSGSSRPSPPWNKIPRRIGAEWSHLIGYTIRTQIATGSLISN